MRKPRLATLAFLLAFVAAPTPGGAAGVSNGWEAITLSMADCLTAAAGAVQRLGFTVRRVDQSVLGWRDDDNITIRCIPDAGLVVIFAYVLQDDGPLSAQLVDALRPAFRRK